MIIKIIPETDEERNRFNECFSTNEIVHSGIREYFVFGNKISQDGQANDFHEWTGSPRYLMGNLRYFFEVVNDERRAKESNGQSIQPPQQTQHPQRTQKINFPNKNIPQNPEDLENELNKINHPKIVMENRTPKIIKRGEVSNIQPIDISNLNNSNIPKIVQMADLKKGQGQPVPNIPMMDRFPYAHNIEEEAADD